MRTGLKPSNLLTFIEAKQLHGGIRWAVGTGPRLHSGDATTASGGEENHEEAKVRAFERE